MVIGKIVQTQLLSSWSSWEFSKILLPLASKKKKEKKKKHCIYFIAFAKALCLIKQQKMSLTT